MLWYLYIAIYDLGYDIIIISNYFNEVVFVNKRLIGTIITGAILGIFCIIGAQARFDGSLETSYLFSFWFNRLIMGMFIGLIVWNISLPMRLLRGLIIGLFISFAFYSSTSFLDSTGFLAGGVYGVIIEYVGFKLEKK